MVEEVARRSVLVDETALIQITIDRLKDRAATGGLLNCEPLSRRKLERLRELVRNLSGSRLNEAG